MKYIYSFFTLLSAILFFSACSGSSTGPDDSFQGQRFGSWITTSETTAEWVGSRQNIKGAAQMAAAGDTTVIDDPKSTKVYLTYFGLGEFDVGILDSSITSGQHDSLDIVNELHIETPDSNLFVDVTANYNPTLNPEAPIRPHFQGTYLCSDSTLATRAVFHHVIRDTEADTVMHTYTLDAKGFSPVLDALICN